MSNINNLRKEERTELMEEAEEMIGDIATSPLDFRYRECDIKVTQLEIHTGFYYEWEVHHDGAYMRADSKEFIDDSSGVMLKDGLNMCKAQIDKRIKNEGVTL